MMAGAVTGASASSLFASGDIVPPGAAPSAYLDTAPVAAFGASFDATSVVAATPGAPLTGIPASVDDASSNAGIYAPYPLVPISLNQFDPYDPYQLQEFYMKYARQAGNAAPADGGEQKAQPGPTPAPATTYAPPAPTQPPVAVAAPTQAPTPAPAAAPNTGTASQDKKTTIDDPIIARLIARIEAYASAPNGKTPRTEQANNGAATAATDPANGPTDANGAATDAADNPDAPTGTNAPDTQSEDMNDTAFPASGLTQPGSTQPGSPQPGAGTAPVTTPPAGAPPTGAPPATNDSAGGDKADAALSANASGDAAINEAAKDDASNPLAAALSPQPGGAGATKPDSATVKLINVTAPKSSDAEIVYKNTYSVCGVRDDSADPGEPITLYLTRYDKEAGGYRQLADINGDTSWSIGANGVFIKSILLEEGENKFAIAACKASVIEAARTEGRIIGDHEIQVVAFTILYRAQSVAEKINEVFKELTIENFLKELSNQ